MGPLPGTLWAYFICGEHYGLYVCPYCTVERLNASHRTRISSQTLDALWALDVDESLANQPIQDSIHMAGHFTIDC